MTQNHSGLIKLLYTNHMVGGLIASSSWPPSQVSLDTDPVVVQLSNNELDSESLSGLLLFFAFNIQEICFGG